MLFSILFSYNSVINILSSWKGYPLLLLCVCVRCRDLYLTTPNTHKRQPSMPPAGFEPAIPKCEQPQIQALDRAATGIGNNNNNNNDDGW